MAGIRASLPVFLLVLLLAIASPLAHATIISRQEVVSVTGQLCCTQNGNCPGTPVPGAVVSLRCSELLIFSSVVAVNTTGVNGFFNITAPITATSILGLSNRIPCVVSVQLPVGGAACPLLSTTGRVLTGILGPVVQEVTQAYGRIMAAQVAFYVTLG